LSVPTIDATTLPIVHVPEGIKTISGSAVSTATDGDAAPVPPLLVAATVNV
jgi:hypothetical protein